MEVATHTRISRKARSALWVLWAGGFLAVSLLFSQRLAAQCPMCQTALTQSEEGQQRWARGVNAGILFLFTVPYVIVGIAAFVIYRPQVMAALSRIRWRWPGRAGAGSLLRADK